MEQIAQLQSASWHVLTTRNLLCFCSFMEDKEAKKEKKKNETRKLIDS